MLTLHDSAGSYIILAKPGKVKPQEHLFRIQPTIFLQGASAMKEKAVAALHVILDFTAENLGFVLICAVAIAVILKLACV